MSCTGFRNRLAPGTWASLGRRRAITWSAEILRSLSGFSVANTKPELVEKPPVKPTTVSTAGSWRTISTNWLSFRRIAWKEMLWSARMPPMMRPVSCCGKKPLGMVTKR